MHHNNKSYQTESAGNRKLPEIRFFFTFFSEPLLRGVRSWAWEKTPVRAGSIRARSDVTSLLSSHRASAPGQYLLLRTDRTGCGDIGRRAAPVCFALNQGCGAGPIAGPVPGFLVLIISFRVGRSRQLRSAAGPESNPRRSERKPGVGVNISAGRIVQRWRATRAASRGARQAGRGKGRPGRLLFPALPIFTRLPANLLPGDLGKSNARGAA